MPIDWTKPLRATVGSPSVYKARKVHYVGMSLKNSRVVQFLGIGFVDFCEDGKSTVCSLENVPERTSVWANVYPKRVNTTVLDRIHADINAVGATRIAVIEYVFEGEDLIETIIHRDL